MYLTSAEHSLSLANDASSPYVTSRKSSERRMATKKAARHPRPREPPPRLRPRLTAPPTAPPQRPHHHHRRRRRRRPGKEATGGVADTMPNRRGRCRSSSSSSARTPMRRTRACTPGPTLAGGGPGGKGVPVPPPLPPSAAAAAAGRRTHTPPTRRWTRTAFSLTTLRPPEPAGAVSIEPVAVAVVVAVTAVLLRPPFGPAGSYTLATTSNSWCTTTNATNSCIPPAWTATPCRRRRDRWPPMPLLRPRPAVPRATGGKGGGAGAGEDHASPTTTMTTLSTRGSGSHPETAGWSEVAAVAAGAPQGACTTPTPGRPWGRRREAQRWRRGQAGTALTRGLLRALATE